MEISDDGSSREGLSPSQGNIRAVFQQLLGLVHIALVEHYEISDLEAFELESDLYSSFNQFSRAQTEISASRDGKFLLFTTCQLGRGYQRYKLDDGYLVATPRLTALLAREPEDVVRDFSKSLDLLKHRYPYV